MRKLIITENDRKDILNQYKVVSVDNKKVISEHQRISELMGVKSKTLILEGGGGKYDWITDMPIFSGWKSTFDEAPQVVKAIESDMAKVSETLAKNGITPDNIRTKSKEWFANYQNKLNITSPMTEGDIIQLYIQKNYVKALDEINTKLAVLYKIEAETGVENILRQIESDPDYTIIVNGKELSISNNDKSLASNNLTQEEFDETAVEVAIKNTESAEAHFNSRMSEENTALANYEKNATRSGRVKDGKPVYSDLEKAAMAKAEKRIASYKKILEHLAVKKKRYQTWKETTAQMEKEGLGTGSKSADEVFTYAGKEYTIPAGLNVFQRFWYRGLIMRSLPLEFFRILGKLIHMAWTKRTFTDKFMQDIAGMTNILRRIETEGESLGTSFKNMGPNELKTYAASIYTELVASVNKKIDTVPTFKDFFTDGFGKGSSAKDIQEAFNRLENMVKSVEGITNEEKQQIMQYLFQRYMASGNTPVKDVNLFRGFMYANEDLKSLGVKSDYFKEADDAIAELNKGIDDGAGKAMDFATEWLFGAVAKENQKKLVAMMTKKIITGLFVGIPSGVKWVFRPIMKGGLSFKSVAKVYVKLCLTKAVFFVSTAVIKFLAFFLGYALLEWTLVKDVTKLTGAEYEAELKDMFVSDILDATTASLIPWRGMDLGWEEEQKDLNAPFGMRKYDAKFGIFESYGFEWFMEFKSMVFTDKSIDVEKSQEDLQQDMYREIDNKVDDGTEDLYKNMTPEQKEEIKKSSGFNNLKTITSPTSEYLGTMGITGSEAQHIEERLFFKPMFQGDIEMIKSHGSWKEFRKSGKTLSTKDVGGFTYICSKPIILDNNNNPICNGGSYRVVVCNDKYFSKDSYFNEYIYNEETHQVGIMYSKYLGKLVYIKNEELKEKFALSVGENCGNIGLVTDLPFI